MHSYNSQIFSSDFWQELASWKRLFISGVLYSSKGINWSSRERGEFEYYSSYNSGDDFRNIDWFVYGRTKQLYTKNFQTPKSQTILILVDGSLSMSVGTPPKFWGGLRIAAAAAYWFLHSGAKVQIGIVRENTIYSKQLTQEQNWHELLSFLSQQNTREVALWDKVPISGDSTKLIILTDLTPFQSRDAIDQLCRVYQRGIVLHLVADEDYNISWQGNWRIIDSETKEQLSIQVTPKISKQYKKIWEEQQQAWQKTFYHNQFTYHLVLSSQPTSKILEKSLNAFL